MMFWKLPRMRMCWSAMTMRVVCGSRIWSSTSRQATDTSGHTFNACLRPSPRNTPRTGRSNEATPPRPAPRIPARRPARNPQTSAAPPRPPASPRRLEPTFSSEVHAQSTFICFVTGCTAIQFLRGGNDSRARYLWDGVVRGMTEGREREMMGVKGGGSSVVCVADARRNSEKSGVRAKAVREKL